MIDSFEYEGLWYLPDKPDKQVGGVLRFSPSEGAILKLTGSLTDFTQHGTTQNHEIILGSLFGKYATLLHCTHIGQGMSEALTIDSYHVGVVFTELHFPAETAITFKWIDVLVWRPNIRV